MSHKVFRKHCFPHGLTRTSPRLRISQPVLDDIRGSLGRLPAERGGVLGGSRADGIVSHFYFDAQADRTGGTYSPDYQTVNMLFKEEWNPAGINLLGFVHSHPPGIRHPSCGDLVYACQILQAIPELPALLLPIVMSEPDAGRFEFIPYAAVRDGDDVRLQAMQIAVIPGKEGESAATDTSIEAGAPHTDMPGTVEQEWPHTRYPVHCHTSWQDTSETFWRVRQAYELVRLERCRLICVGTGGAAGFVEEMARAGIGEHILIDPDIFSETNIGTQQAYRRDIGRPKVECLAERILDINPNAIVIPVQKTLDEIDDAEFERLAREPVPGALYRFQGVFHGVDGFLPVPSPPVVTLICGLTDSFVAQARINRLALHFSLPSLCAQVYREGRCAELTFTYPGVTPACHRCVLSSRYKAYLQEGFNNDVTSDGTPIFSTTRLNALKGFIAMAILHHGTDHPRWGRLLERIGPRNLVQIRMDPDLEANLGLKAFGRVFGGGDQERILFDEAVWLPQKPDCPENGYPICPDCGGSGDLRKASGTFADTRVMRE